MYLVDKTLFNIIKICIVYIIINKSILIFPMLVDKITLNMYRKAQNTLNLIHVLIKKVDWFFLNYVR